MSGERGIDWMVRSCWWSLHIWCAQSNFGQIGSWTLDACRIYVKVRSDEVMWSFWGPFTVTMWMPVGLYISDSLLGSGEGMWVWRDRFVSDDWGICDFAGFYSISLDMRWMWRDELSWVISGRVGRVEADVRMRWQETTAESRSDATFRIEISNWPCCCTFMTTVWKLFRNTDAINQQKTNFLKQDCADNSISTFNIL